MNLIQKILNYFRPQPTPTVKTKDKEQLKEQLKNAVVAASDLIQTIVLEPEEVTMLQKLILEKPTEKSTMGFINKLSDRTLDEPCGIFDKAYYEMRSDIAELNFEDFCEVTLCVDASRTWIMSQIEAQINELLKETVLSYMMSEPGKKAAGQVLMENSIILQNTIGDA